MNHKSISIVRMGDGECKIVKADTQKPFDDFSYLDPLWNKRLGIDGMPIRLLQKNIIKAGNTCTYFAPSLSGISYDKYFLYNFFKSRSCYFDNFYVNDWTKSMIAMLFEKSDGIFIIHKDYKKIIRNFKKNYNLTKKSAVVFGGFSKKSWEDNEQAVHSAIESGMQLILFSAGPGGKIIGPQIAEAKNKIVLDVGNTLIPWSIKES